jgi:hypothetical protein
VTAQFKEIIPTLNAGSANSPPRIVANLVHRVQYKQADAVNYLMLDWLT